MHNQNSTASTLKTSTSVATLQRLVLAGDFLVDAIARLMKTAITSLHALCAAVQQGMPAELALAAYYEQRSTEQLRAEYSECSKTTARWEEAGRADQVAIQRRRLVAIGAELKVRGEVVPL
jgi:hypothetical protein